MQKVKLNRIGAEPTYVEVPDDCVNVIDMTAVLTFKKMYDAVKKRYRKPKAIYFNYWEKGNDGKWVLHNEPLEEMIRMGYLNQDNLRPLIKKVLAEGINEKQPKQLSLETKLTP